MRIAFFGNHSVGVNVLKAIIEEAMLVGVVAHPEDPEDGVRYLSVFDFACLHNIPSIRGKGIDSHVKDFLVSIKPDLIWVTDYRYILPDDLLEVPHKGGVNLHPSLLPKYRGRAPINWAILNGESYFGLTAHFLSSEMDDGDIIEQKSFELTINEDVGDALDKLLPLYDKITRNVITYFYEGNVPRKLQNNSSSTVYRARKPKDGNINWNDSAINIRNLIRAVAKPYPGAFTSLGGKKIYIWKSILHKVEGYFKEIPGTIIEKTDTSFSVVCGDGVLKILRYTFEVDVPIPILNGMKFYK